MGSEEEDDQRLRALFHKLDVDGNGRIDSKDLIEALRRSGHHSPLDSAHVNNIIQLLRIYIIGFNSILHICYSKGLMSNVF